MVVLMDSFAKQKNVDIDSLRFRLDGENLNVNDSPKALDLEGGECIDVYQV